MSISRHPIALRLERQVGGSTRLLATVMLLPLVDGIFPALVLSGALDSVVGILQVGLLVFGGSATLAVIIAEMEADRRSQTQSVLLVGIPLIVIAALEAALAPTIASLIDIVIFERFAAIVILAVAAKTASATIGDYLPRPSIIIGLGTIASLDPGSVSLVLTTDMGLIARAAAAGTVGVVFSLGVVFLRPYLDDLIDIDRFRFGSAVALGTLSLSIPNLVPSEAPLGVFAIAALLAFEPAAESMSSGSDSVGATTPDGGDEPSGDDLSEHVDREPGEPYVSDTPSNDRVPWL